MNTDPLQRTLPHFDEPGPGRVFYVIAEGARGIGRRLAAWDQHHDNRLRLNGQHASDITWRPQAVNLFDPLDVEPLLIALDHMPMPKLIVFDTLARCTLGAEESLVLDRLASFA